MILQPFWPSPSEMSNFLQSTFHVWIVAGYLGSSIPSGFVHVGVWWTGFLLSEKSHEVDSVFIQRLSVICFPTFKSQAAFTVNVSGFGKLFNWSAFLILEGRNLFLALFIESKFSFAGKKNQSSHVGVYWLELLDRAEHQTIRVTLFFIPSLALWLGSPSHCPGSQLTVFCRSSSEGRDRAGCSLDRQSVWVCDLGCVRSRTWPGRERPCQLVCFQYIVTFPLLKFFSFAIISLPVFWLGWCDATHLYLSTWQNLSVIWILLISEITNWLTHSLKLKLRWSEKLQHAALISFRNIFCNFRHGLWLQFCVHHRCSCTHGMIGS